MTKKKEEVKKITQEELDTVKNQQNNNFVLKNYEYIMKCNYIEMLNYCL